MRRSEDQGSNSGFQALRKEPSLPEPLHWSCAHLHWSDPHHRGQTGWPRASAMQLSLPPCPRITRMFHHTYIYGCGFLGGPWRCIDGMASPARFPTFHLRSNRFISGEFYTSGVDIRIPETHINSCCLHCPPLIFKDLTMFF